MASNRLPEMPPGLRSLIYNATPLSRSPSTSSHLNRITPLLQTRLVSTDHLPRVAQPSLWQSMIPKPLRRDPHPARSPSNNSTKLPSYWTFIKSNPATPLLLLALLIGSQAIHTIVLRRETVAFSRLAEAKIALLKEVVERLQRGEDVDVEGLLGTGVPEREAEWESVLGEIERADVVWRKEKKPKTDSGASEPGSEEVVKMVADEAHVDATKAVEKPAEERRKIGQIPKGFY